MTWIGTRTYSLKVWRLGKSILHSEGQGCYSERLKAVGKWPDKNFTQFNYGQSKAPHVAWDNSPQRDRLLAKRLCRKAPGKTTNCPGASSGPSQKRWPASLRSQESSRQGEGTDPAPLLSTHRTIWSTGSNLGSPQQVTHREESSRDHRGGARDVQRKVERGGLGQPCRRRLRGDVTALYNY